MDLFDEQTATYYFENMVGGTAKADEMLRLWRDSYQCDMRPQGKLHTRQEVFEKKAKRAGFTQEQIDCFYNLQ